MCRFLLPVAALLVSVAAVRQNFGQGNITVTTNPLDMAVNGAGFYRMSSNGSILYTRNGQFSEDKTGNVVSATGQALQVYPPLANGGFNTGTLTNLNLQTAQSAPLATTSAPEPSRFMRRIWA